MTMQTWNVYKLMHFTVEVSLEYAFLLNSRATHNSFYTC